MRVIQYICLANKNFFEIYLKYFLTKSSQKTEDDD